MPGDIINYTSAGWPYLDDENYWDVAPAYSEELAQKLQNGEADVAAAINAANIVQQLVASWPPTPLALGDGFTAAGSTPRVQRTGGTVTTLGLTRIPESPSLPATIAVLPPWAAPDNTVYTVSYSSVSGSVGFLKIESGGAIIFDPASLWNSNTPTGRITLHATWAKQQVA